MLEEISFQFVWRWKELSSDSVVLYESNVDYEILQVSKTKLMQEISVKTKILEG